MALEKRLGLVLNDTLEFVADVLWENPEIPFERLKEIADEVSGFRDVEATRSRILKLAGVAPVEAA